MKIFLTGGTGFVGKHVLRELVKKHDVKVLARPGSKSSIPKDVLEKVEVVEGDILNRQLILNSTKGVDAVINLVGILREFPDKGMTFDRLHVEATFNCILAAQQNNVKRFLQMSAMGAREDAESEYHRTKFKADVLVKNSGLEYVIFRPTIMFGNGENAISMLADRVRSSRAFPLLGGGKSRWQPVYVGDVAKAFVKCLKSRKAKNSVLELGGPEIYELKELIRLIAEKQSKRIIMFPVPFWLVKIPTYFFQQQEWYPLGMDMVKMLEEDNIVQDQNFDEVLNIKLNKLEDFMPE